tara:strand:- start:305 stop:685 length:381 start_codon:yes stop_codon:yes gene_type:complete
MIRDYIYKIITKIKQMAHKSNYIEKIELEKIKEIKSRISNISISLAQMSLHKDELKQELKKVTIEQENLTKILEKKYGNVNISLADGEWTSNNEDKEPEIDLGKDPSFNMSSSSGSGSGKGVNWGG